MRAANFPAIQSVLDVCVYVPFFLKWPKMNKLVNSWYSTLFNSTN